MLLRKRTAKVMGIAALGVGLATLTASPASASTWWAYHGDDYATYSDTDGYIAVCDMEQDGHGVFGQYKKATGTLFTVRDRNGSSGGCGNDYVTGVYVFRVCEELTAITNCGAWRYL